MNYLVGLKLRAGKAGAMNYNKGELGRVMAQKLWPSIALVKGGSSIDLMGVDAYEGEEAIQIKYDETIARTRNLYHEIYEKSINHTEQNWRNSPHKCDSYIFCTKGYAIKLSVQDLAIAELGLVLTQISATSIGFLIPISKVRGIGDIRNEP